MTKFELAIAEAGGEDALRQHLYRMYHEEERSLQECADAFQVSLTAMFNWFRKLGIPTDQGRRRSGSKHYLWNGGRSVTSLGYVQVTVPDHPYADSRGRVYEHRLVMEKHLGRYLRPDEEVHHINKNPSDNRIENLVLVTKTEHRRLHAKERKTNIQCSMCDKRAIAKGLCKYHYMKKWHEEHPGYRKQRREMANNERRRESSSPSAG